MKVLQKIKCLFPCNHKEKLLCSMAFNYHDSSVAFAVGNNIVLVLEAERVFRVKKKSCNKEEMEFLVKYGLLLLKKDLADVDYWAMTTFNNPYLSESDIVNKTENIIREPYYKKVNFFGLEKKVLIINHHAAHAGVFLSTEFKSAIIISCDGGGDIDPKTNTNECLAVFNGNKNIITKQHLLPKKFISGKTYGICSTFLYNTRLHNKNSVEGKFMALAGLGVVQEDYYNFLAQNFNKIEKADYSEVLKILENSQLKGLQGQAALETQEAKDFAATVHNFFINKRLEDISYIVNKTYSNQEALILAGGASLNIDLNTKVIEKFPSVKHFIAPCCDDTGQSLGALCILINDKLNLRPTVKFPYLGEGTRKFNYTIETLDKAVDTLLKDGVLILHNGKSEIGPRALGNRSFIARPDSQEVKKMLSEKIKQREHYRPIAPVVLEDRVGEYFIGPKKSPFMLYKYNVIKSKIQKIVGAVHVDGSARVQTVDQHSNLFLYNLIKRFGDRTGIYVLLNTSLNLCGEPLTNKIEESLNIFNKINGHKAIIYDGKIIEQS